MGILDELRALGLQAKATARDLRDFVSVHIGGGVPGAGGGGAVGGGSLARGANSVSKFILREIKGIGGIAGLLGFAQTAHDIFGRPRAHADLSLFHGQELRDEESQQAKEKATRQLGYLTAAGALMTRVPGLQAFGAVLAGASELAHLALNMADENEREQKARSMLQDFIRNNSLGDNNKPTWTRMEDMIKKYGTAENALKTELLKKDRREQGMEEISNRIFLRGARHLGEGGVWKDPSRIYSQLETARRAAKIHARTFMMRAGNRDDED